MQKLVVVRLLPGDVRAGEAGVQAALRAAELRAAREGRSATQSGGRAHPGSE